MKKVISLCLILVLSFGMVTSSFANKDLIGLKINDVIIETLEENENIRKVKSTSEKEIVIATYYKNENKMELETIETSMRSKASSKTEVLRNIKAPSIEQLDEAEILLKNSDFRNKSKSVNLGNSSVRTRFGDYGYFNIWSFARIKAGDNRSLMAISSSNFEDDYVLDKYDNFTDSIDDIKHCEDIAAIALGGETLAYVAGLILAPEITVTKLGAILAALGIGSTLLSSLISWQWNAHTARKYYDRIEARIN